MSRVLAAYALAGVAGLVLTCMLRWAFWDDVPLWAPFAVLAMIGAVQGLQQVAPMPHVSPGIGSLAVAIASSACWFGESRQPWVSSPA